MGYAIRTNGAGHGGMLIEMDSRALAKIEAQQRAEDAVREAYWAAETAEERAASEAPADTYPYYDRCSADRAHKWVKGDLPHETLLYIEDGKIRRAA